jgi:hypothetical protein
MAEYSTHIPKIKGLNPTIYSGKEKNGINLKDLFWLCPSSTMVDQSTHIPKIKGLNPATDTRREKMSKSFGNILLLSQ